MDRTIFEPYANAGFVHFNSDEFGEAGRTAASLSVTSATLNTWFTTIGLRAATELDIGETLVTARGDIGWRHSYGDVTPRRQQALSDPRRSLFQGRRLPGTSL